MFVCKGSILVLIIFQSANCRPLPDYSYPNYELDYSNLAAQGSDSDDYNEVNPVDYDDSMVNPYPDIHPVNNQRDAMHYLSQFGYMEPKMEDTMDMDSDQGHEMVKHFQAMMGLGQSGQLDNETLEMMNRPRCGDPDMPDAMDHFGQLKSKRHKRFELQGSQWPNRTLTWKVVKYSAKPTLVNKKREIDRTVQLALETWATVSGLKFAKAGDTDTKADIEISFVVGDHGDRNAFDGPGKTLAHAFFPKFGGNCHFDDAEKWTLSSERFGTSLLSVAIHEFGHSLGLAHSKIKRSIMFASYTGSTSLHEDDVQGIQRLYGKPSGPAADVGKKKKDADYAKARSSDGQGSGWWSKFVGKHAQNLKGDFASWYKRFRACSVYHYQLQSISRRGALMVSCEDLSISGSGDQPMGSSGPSATASHEGSLKSHKRSPLSRSRSGGIFSNPFRNDHDKMEQLTEILNQYSLTGIPEQNAILTMKRRPGEDSDDELFYLEEHWRHIVAHADHLDKKVQSQQDAIWELIETEVFYIKRLRVVTDLFLACLCNLQNECLLNDTDIDKMFSNIQQVYEANHQFWLNYLLPMLNSSRSSQLPLNPILMKDGFLKFDQLFYPYIKYCLEHSSCLQYVKEKHKESELFKAYVVWCETRKDCERLRLMDLLVKPMQRLTKYSLLLKAILRKTDSEFDATALKRMNESVEQFVLAVDASLRQRHEEEKLACVVSRIESYDVIDCGLGEEIEKVGKDYCRVDFLTRPMIGCRSHQIRKLVLEGSGLKLKESPSSSKMDVHCLLFTDLLLVCKATGRKNLDRVRIIRQPYLVERLVPIELKDSSSFALLYVNELKVASALLTVYSPDARTWLDHIRRAQELYSEAKQRANQSPSSLGRSVADSERDLYGHIAPKALLSAYSPRSSRSSFCHSYSGSVDQTSDLGSVLGSSLGLNIPPAPTPATVGAVHHQQPAGHPAPVWRPPVPGAQL
ncbi:Pleckstrin homology domain-containing family G member 5 [Halotydeus destructor]|nr:Pleckstrin homology domain-containing family G member 5 [Halotydeus destructor]